MRLTALLVGLAVAVGSVDAQTPQNPTFRSTTSLVLVDVSVLDQNGQPVPGLGVDDFEVRLNGRVAPVKTVLYEQAAQNVLTPSGPSTGSSSNVVPLPGVTNAKANGDQRVFVVMVDDLSITPGRDKSLFFSAARFVRGVPPTDAVGFMTSSRSAIVSPTFDHAAIATALEHSVGDLIDPTQLPGPAIGLQEAINIANGDHSAFVAVVERDCTDVNGVAVIEEAALQSTCAEDVTQKAHTVGGQVQNTTGRQLQAYLDVIGALRTLPGLKQLVILTDGMALATHPDSSVLLDPLAKAAAAAGVQLSVLSAEPDLSDVSQNADSLHGLDRLAEARALRSSVQTIAEMTGGTYYNVIGLADSAFARVGLASSAMYQLGVSPTDGSAPGRDYTLVVHVNRPGVTVRANRRAVAPLPPTKTSEETQLKQALATGAPLFGVPLSVDVSRRRGDSPGQITVDISLDVPGTVRGPLNVTFALGDAKGLVQSGRTTLATPNRTGDYRATLSLPVAPGSYRLRFAIADGDQRVGSLETPISAQLNTMGSLLASDLMTTWTAADNEPHALVLGRMPVNATRLLARLELYPGLSASMPADVRAHFSLLTHDETSVAEQDGRPSSTAGSWRSAADFPLQGVLPGSYTLRATITVGGATLGALSAVVDVSGPTRIFCTTSYSNGHS